MSEEDWWRTRAYVHLLSNRVVLAGDEFAKHYREIASGQYPSVLVPRFIHEATHHATFHTPFCTALCFELSEAERALLNPAPIRGDLVGPAKKFLLFMLLQRALNPMFEGIACFAEYDLSPGPSNTLSQPSSMLFTLLALGRLKASGHGLHVWSSDPGELLRDAQRDARLDAEYLAKRARFLASCYNPLRSSHLFGYVFFKALWRTAKARTKAFEDPELFLSFVLEHVFVDPAAMTLVLEPIFNVQASLKAVLDRIGVRLREIACDDESVAADSLDRRGGEREKSDVELQLERRMEDRLNSTKDTCGEQGEQSDGLALAWRQARQFAFRDYVSLGTVRVRVVCDGGGTVSAENAMGEPLQQASLFRGSSLKGEQEGWLEVVFAPDRSLLAGVISLDKHGPVAASMLTRKALAGELEEAFGAYPGCIQSFESDTRLSFEACIRDAATLIAHKERKRACDEMAQWVKDAYCDGLNLNLFGKAPQLWQWRSILGAENGFAAFLDDDELTTLAAAGTLIPGDTSSSWLHTVLGKDGDERLSDLARKLEEKLATPVLTGPPWGSWL